MSRGVVSSFVGMIQAFLKLLLTLSILRGADRAQSAQRRLEHLLDDAPPETPVALSDELLEKIASGDLSTVKRIHPRRALLQPREEGLMEIQGALALDRVRAPGSFQSLGVSAGGISLRSGRVQLAGSGSLRRSLGRGDLVATTERLIFLGDEITLDLPLSKIVGVTPFNSGFEVNVSGSLKVYAFHTVLDGLIPAAVVKGAARQLVGRKSGELPPAVPPGSGSSVTFSRKSLGDS